jgi:hypothetical protein
VHLSSWPYLETKQSNTQSYQHGQACKARGIKHRQ